MENCLLYTKWGKNLDRCPETGALIFCTFPRVKGGSGFSARPIALVPKK